MILRNLFKKKIHKKYGIDLKIGNYIFYNCVIAPNDTSNNTSNELVPITFRIDWSE